MGCNVSIRISAELYTTAWCNYLDQLQDESRWLPFSDWVAVQHGRLSMTPGSAIDRDIVFENSQDAVLFVLKWAAE